MYILSFVKYMSEIKYLLQLNHYFERQKNSRRDANDFKQIYLFEYSMASFAKKNRQISSVSLDSLEFKTK